MSISGISSLGGISPYSDIVRKNRGGRVASGVGHGDTVSISNEAMEKYLAMKNGGKSDSPEDVVTAVSDWYDNFRENMGMVDEPDFSTWPPENLERRRKLVEERDALAPYTSNTSFTEINRKMIGIQNEIMALDAVGGQQVLSSNDMAAAVDSLHTAMDRWESNPSGTAAWSAGEGSFAEGGAHLQDLSTLLTRSSGESGLSPEELERLKNERRKQELLA